MLTETTLSIIYNIFSFLSTPINIPDMPAKVEELFTQFLDYINMGLSILAAYTHIEYLLVLFGIVVAVDIGVILFKLIMWVIKKIPFLGIE